MTSSTARPYRVVDREGQGWYLASTGDGGTTYKASYGWQRDLPDVPDLGELAEMRGPLRPVLSVTDADQEQLEAQLRQAGRKAVTTLAAALATTYQGLRKQLGGRAIQHIKAGREGSWESECLITVIIFGTELKPRRVLPEARDALTTMLTGWVTNPDRYTEVAETLAGIVSSYADREHGPDGWKRIADQWLQPGSMAEADFRATYQWLYSQSEYFDSGLL
jgi:hypothetical protein